MANKPANNDELHAISSSYGDRGSSPDELARIVARQIEREPQSTWSTPNAGARDVWVPRFLKALAKTANWSLAARAAGVDRTTPYHRAAMDSVFATEAREAESEAMDMIEAAAFKSAVYGDLEPVFYEGVQVGEIVKYSDRMREFLLKAGRPEKYRERLSIETKSDNRPALSAEERRDLVLELLPTLADYARFLKAKPITETRGLR
jgi:hypothetical protein